MTIDTLPSASDVRSETGLNKSQVGGGYATTEAMESYIDTIINNDVAPDVTEQIKGAESTARRQLLATRAVKEISKAQLLLNSGQLNEAYTNKAAVFQSDGDRLIALINSVDIVLDGTDTAFDNVAVLTISVGDDSPADEYSSAY